MPRREISNEQYLKDRVKETGGETRKVKWVGRRGAPDRFVGWPGSDSETMRLHPRGVSVWVEVKEEEQPWGLQKHQRREIDWLTKCGQRVAVLESKEQIDGFIRFHTGK